MTWETEALKKDVPINVVISIDGVFYAIKEPDTGLVVDADKLVLKRPRINGVNVDIRKASTPIGSFSFQLSEQAFNPVISSTIMQDESFFLKKEVVAYAGFNTGSFDFADYREIARTRIKQVTKVANGYSIRSTDATGLADEEGINVNDSSLTQMIPPTTSIDVINGDKFPASGVIKIDAEFMAYASKDGNTLENITRGILNTDAGDHEVGAKVYLVTEALAVNPITFFLQCLLSKDGDGTNHPTYDVFANGIGISPDDIDIAQIEGIRDEFFLGEEHNYRIYNNKTILRLLERTVFTSTNTRLVSLDGKISLALLDEVDFTDELQILDESTVVGTPTWTLDETKIVNVIEISYDFNVATNQYESTATFSDDDSIATFGEKPALKLNFEGVYTVLGGGLIVEERANRLLGRLATARGSVTVTSHFDAANLNVGGNVQLVHRYLPQQGGSLGISDRLEVMSRSIDLGNKTVKTKLDFTSYTGIRIAFIAPSPRIVTVIDQKTIEVSDASCLRKGWTIRLFEDGPLDIENNPTNGSYLPDAINTIDSIVGNVVTFTNEFTSILSNKVTVKMADYDNATEEQRARYAFIGSNTGFFSDGSKSYQIIF